MLGQNLSSSYGPPFELGDRLISTGINWCRCFKTASNVHRWVLGSNCIHMFSLCLCIFKQLCERVYVNINNSHLSVLSSALCIAVSAGYTKALVSLSCVSRGVQASLLCDPSIRNISRSTFHWAVLGRAGNRGSLLAAPEQGTSCSALRDAGMPPASASLVAKTRLQPFHL